MEGWTAQCQQSGAGTYDCAHDAYDWRDCLPVGSAVGRGRDGAGKGRAVFRDGGKAGVPYALQCHNDGDDMAHGCDARRAAVEKTA